MILKISDYFMILTILRSCNRNNYYSLENDMFDEKSLSKHAFISV